MTSYATQFAAEATACRKRTGHCVILCGGISGERDISLKSGMNIARALSAVFDVSILDPAHGRAGWQRLDHPLKPLASPPSEIGFPELVEALWGLTQIEHFNRRTWIVFNALHGTWGEDGRAQALLEALGIQFTGSVTAAASLAMNKQRAKLIAKAHGLNIAPGFCLHRAQIDQLEIGDHPLWGRLEALMTPEIPGVSLVVKPNDQGSAIATQICPFADRRCLLSAFREVFAIGDWALVERFIPGRELTIGILEERVLPSVEIGFEGDFYDYRAKYESDSTQYSCPAPMHEGQKARLGQLALGVHRAIGARDFSRSDFRLCGDRAYFLELNALPGMTATSLFPKAAQEAGLSFLQTCSQIANCAFARANQLTPNSQIAK